MGTDMEEKGGVAEERVCASELEEKSVDIPLLQTQH